MRAEFPSSTRFHPQFCRLRPKDVEEVECQVNNGHEQRNHQVAGHSHVPVGPFIPSNSGLGAGKWSAPDSLKPLGDCNPEQEPEPTADTADAVALSLCGGLADSRDVSMGMLGGGPCPPED